MKHKRHIGKHYPSLGNFKALRENIFAALSLVVVFGLVWGFGLLVLNYPIEEVTIIFQYLFSVAASIQGILLFLLHGVCNSDARKIWKSGFSSLGSSSKVFYQGSSSSKVTSKPPAESNNISQGSATYPDKLNLKNISESGNSSAEATEEASSRLDTTKIDLSESHFESKGEYSEEEDARNTTSPAL